MLQISYIKRNNTKLFESFSKHSNLKIDQLINYNPIYSQFFSLNDINYNLINLNHTWHLRDILEEEEEEQVINDSKSDSESQSDNLITILECDIVNVNNKKRKKKDVFFKMAPIINPYKYLVGKYGNIDFDQLQLPSQQNVNIKYKTISSEIQCAINNHHNASYVDGFFTYLSNTLFHSHNLFHAVQFYGSFIGIKNQYELNVMDDLDILLESEFFHENQNKLFQMDHFEEFISTFKCVQKPITINHNTSLGSITSLSCDKIQDGDDIISSNKIQNCNNDDGDDDDLVTTIDDLHLIDLDDIKSLSLDLNDITKSASNLKLYNDNSSCSSRTSHTSLSTTKSNEKKSNTKTELDNNDDKSSSNDDESSSNDDDDDDYVISVKIPKFPVNVICMESCDDTFDNIIYNGNLSVDEWYSALFQIIMTLVVYQKVFQFTHNDLHTNNVMFIETNQPFLYYQYNNITYKVPSFGRIYKLIDFGRSIYTVNGIRFASDSFDKNGDAETQYNTEPYFELLKPRIDPNYSFDLCRLGCSIFDYLIDDMEDIDKYTTCIDINSMEYIKKIIIEWCSDDQGVNILYKKNNEDRYPGFKLYKMIARHVHHHVPSKQLNRPPFQKYIYSKPFKNKDFFMNIDSMNNV